MTLLREYTSVFVPPLVVLAAAGPGSSVTSFGNKPEHTAEKYTLRPASLPVMYQSFFRNWRNSRSGLECLRLLHHRIVPHSHMHVSQNMNVHLLTAAIKATLSARGYVAPVDATWWRPLDDGRTSTASAPVPRLKVDERELGSGSDGRQSGHPLWCHRIYYRHVGILIIYDWNINF